MTPTQVKKEEPQEVKIETKKGVFKCYNCGEPGHMSRNCTKPRKERKVRAVATDDVKGWWTKVLEDDKKEMMRHLGFQNPE